MVRGQLEVYVRDRKDGVNVTKVYTVQEAATASSSPAASPGATPTNTPTSSSTN